MRAGVTVVVIAAVVAAAHGGTTVAGGVILFTSVLVLASPIVVGWRILHHPQVTPETILGGVCIYVLIGMVFAIFDYGLQLASGIPLLRPVRPSRLTRLCVLQLHHHGHRRLRGPLARTGAAEDELAVLEALTGQVFLVVLLARLVSLYRGADRVAPRLRRTAPRRGRLRVRPTPRRPDRSRARRPTGSGVRGARPAQASAAPDRLRRPRRPTHQPPSRAACAGGGAWTTRRGGPPRRRSRSPRWQRRGPRRARWRPARPRRR